MYRDSLTRASTIGNYKRRATTKLTLQTCISCAFCFPSSTTQRLCLKTTLNAFSTKSVSTAAEKCVLMDVFGDDNDDDGFLSDIPIASLRVRSWNPSQTRKNQTQTSSKAKSPLHFIERRSALYPPLRVNKATTHGVLGFTTQRRHQFLRKITHRHSSLR